MSGTTATVKNWMHMVRWIVKMIRDEFGIEEARLTRNAELDSGCGLSVEQQELVLDQIAENFGVRFPDGTLDEIVRLEDLCMLASWMYGLYKKPDFVSDDFEARCREINTITDAHE